MSFTAQIQCYWGTITQFYVIRSPTGLAAAPCDKQPQSDVASMSQPLWEAEGLNQPFKPALYLLFPGWVLNVCQSAIVTVWVSFSIGEELAMLCNINIRCDQPARDAKQTAEPCWDVSSLKCCNVRQWVNHSAVCLFCFHRGRVPSAFPFSLLRASVTAHSKANRRKKSERCRSLLLLLLSQGWEGLGFCSLAFSRLMNHSLRG